MARKKVDDWERVTKVYTKISNAKVDREGRLERIAEYGRRGYLNGKWRFVATKDNGNPVIPYEEVNVDLDTGYIINISAFEFMENITIDPDSAEKEQEDWVRAGDRPTGKIQGPGSMTGKFTMSMFRGQSWIPVMDKLLEIIDYDKEGNKIEVLPKIMDKGILYTAQLFIDILDNLFKVTNLGDALSGKTVDESTRAFAGEPIGDYTEQGGYSRGTVPKRVEAIMDNITKGIEVIIEDLIMYVHETIDEKIGARNERTIEGFRRFIGKFSDEEEMPIEVVEQQWRKIQDHVRYALHTIGEDLLMILVNVAKKEGVDLKRNLKIELSDALKAGLIEVMLLENTKRWAAVIYTSVIYKSLQGMGGRSEQKWSRKFGDILQPGEIEWLEENTQRQTTQMGPFAIDQVSPPDIDERTGILKPVQTDARTGEEYYIPQDIGVVDTDFDPADEKFEEDEELAAQGDVDETPSYTERKPRYKRTSPTETEPIRGKSNAPNVRGYKRGEGSRVPPEWQQFQEKHASENLPIKDWFSVLKKDGIIKYRLNTMGGHKDDAANFISGEVESTNPIQWPADQLNYRANFGKLYGIINNVMIPRHDNWRLRDKENSAKHEKWKQTLMNYMKETKQMIKDKEEKYGFQRRME